MLRHSKPLLGLLFVFGPVAAARAGVIPVPRRLLASQRSPLNHFGDGAKTYVRVQQLIDGTVDGTNPLKCGSEEAVL
jgi:hypothetical protein